MSTLPEVQEEVNEPLSDEHLAAKEDERQARARASLERLGLAGQIAVRTSRVAPLGFSPKSEVSETSIPNQPVRVPNDNDQLEKAQVTLLSRIWTVLNRVSGSLDKQLEYAEEQSLEEREQRLESAQGPQPLNPAVNDNDEKSSSIVKMLALALGPVVAPIVEALAPLVGIAAGIAGISQVLKIPAVKDFEEKGGVVGFIGDKTGLWQGNPVADKIHDLEPDWMKRDLITGKVDGGNTKKANQVRVVKALKARGFDNREIAQIMGQIDAESKFKSQSEKISYKQAQAQYQNNKYLGNKAPGDGYRYRGRGLNQLTGRANYVDMDKKLGLNGQLVANPDLANDPEIAARVVAQYYADRRKKKNVVKHGGLRTAAGATAATAPGGNRAKQVRDRGLAASHYSDQIIEALAGVKSSVQELSKNTTVMKDSVVKAIDSTSFHKETTTGVGVQATTTQNETQKVISGLAFGAELNSRNTWARSRDLRNLQTPSLHQTMIKPTPPAADQGILSPLRNLFGGHKGQRPPVSIDSTGNIPSPSADTTTLNYKLYFYTQ